MRTLRTKLVTTLAIGAVGASGVLLASGLAAGAPGGPLGKRGVSDARLASELFRVLKAKDRKGLAALLSPAFLLQRQDGSYLTKNTYLANPAVVDSFRLTSFFSTRRGNVRVIRYTAVTSEKINGKEVTKAPVPRLSTFLWTGKRWQLIAHANFSTLAK